MFHGLTSFQVALLWQFLKIKKKKKKKSKQAMSAGVLSGPGCQEEPGARICPTAHWPLPTVTFYIHLLNIQKYIGGNREKRPPTAAEKGSSSPHKNREVGHLQAQTPACATRTCLPSLPPDLRLSMSQFKSSDPLSLALPISVNIS